MVEALEIEVEHDEDMEDTWVEVLEVEVEQVEQVESGESRFLEIMSQKYHILAKAIFSPPHEFSSGNLCFPFQTGLPLRPVQPRWFSRSQESYKFHLIN